MVRRVTMVIGRVLPVLILAVMIGLLIIPVTAQAYWGEPNTGSYYDPSGWKLPDWSLQYHLNA